MVSMKRKPTKSRGLNEAAVAYREEYPYGLTISLDKESMEKLSITELPAVGATMMVMAKVKVSSVSEHSDEGGGHRSVSLQITDMELGDGKKKDAASKLYA